MSLHQYWYLRPKTKAALAKLTDEQRRMLARVDYGSKMEAAKARLRLQLKLQVELEVASGIGVAA
jgi:hypothetical protein